MRTNIVLDEKLVAKAMQKSGAKTMREAVDTALREYVSEPDYEGLLALAGADRIDPEYDPQGRLSSCGDRVSRCCIRTATSSASRSSSQIFS